MVKMKVRDYAWERGYFDPLHWFLDVLLFHPWATLDSSTSLSFLAVPFLYFFTITRYCSTPYF
ncbi:hypothetical protein GW17_00028059 [Ensete ventricosum]|nr:hypothetical protein GW17_00028059 [Ensete ventricosum]RZS16246.1 hypothetical protein BHM03_00048211 [Ensete ventricosum]